MVTQWVCNIRPSRVVVLFVALLTALAVMSAAPATADTRFVLCPTDSLQAAIDASAPGDSISVNGICDENILIDRDLSISGGFFEGTIDGGARGSVVTIASGVSVTLDGFTIRNGRAVQGGGILNHGDLYIHDSRVEDNILYDGLGDPATMAGAGIYNTSEATLWMREVWVERNESFSGAGGVENAGDARLQDCWVLENWSLFDAGGVENRGTMDISGCEIADNLGKAAALEHGPGGVGNWGTMTISFSTIQNNITWEGTGGGIKNAGTLRVTNSVVSGNRAPFGAGVFVTGGGTAELLDSGITDNWAGGQGGGLYLDDATTVSLDGTNISDNHARTGGGGASVRWSAELTGEGVDFTSNSAQDQHSQGAGGGIFVIGGTVELSDSTISFNAPAKTGGGISMTSGANVTLANTAVSYNDAELEGGGIHNYQSALSLAGSSIEANVAFDGGGLSSTNGEGPRSTLTVTDTAIFDNHAGRWGGGVYNVAAALNVSKSVISSNSAGESGGGLFNKRGAQQAMADLRNTTVGTNVAPAGAGVFNHYADLLLVHVTMTRNGGGAALDGAWPATRSPNVQRSILAGNSDGDCESALPISGGFSVVGDCALGFGNGDITGVDDPQLDPQFAPDGYLELYMPRLHSPAVDLVPSDACVDNVDQRFISRPQGSACDSGSIELEQAADVDPPSVTVGFPFGESFTEVPITLHGSAADDTGVARVRVAIRDRNTKKWLQDDMVSWGSINRFPATLSNPDAMATDWSFTVSLPDGQYNLSVIATDLAGRTARIRPWHHFNVTAEDAVLPTVDADYPQNTVFDTDPVTLTGTATDNTGVDRVLIAIRHRASGTWLQADKTSWGSFYRFSAALSSPGGTATDWSFEASLPDGGYTTSLHAVDLSGNEVEMPRWRRFAVKL